MADRRESAIFSSARFHYGKQSVESARGESSHQEHPFIALVAPGTTQKQGRACQ